MFRSATLKVTGLYLGIIILICLIFSVALYNALSGDFERNFQRQQDLFFTHSGFESYENNLALQQLYDNQVQEGKRHIITELAYVDLIFLISGGFASYFLARKTLQPIEESHTRQAQFTSDASHELRTPLATMQTEIEVALRDPKLNLKDAKQLLDSNLEELSSLRHLTDGLLQLARETEQSIETSLVSLNDIVQTALLRVKVPLAQKQIKVTRTVPKQLKIYGNRTNLIELLVILLENATKYSTKKGAINIRVTGTRDQLITILVTDDGIGISSKDLPYIFNRFYRADNARTHTVSSGHGLGLAIAKQIATRHDGTISAKSKIGSGTTIQVELPRQSGTKT